MLLLIKYYNEKVKGKNKLDTPESIMESTMKYLETQDAVGQFIRQHYDITNNIKDKIKSSQLMNDFKQCDYYNGMIAANKFTEQLKAMGLKSSRGGNANYWLGLKKKIVEVEDGGEEIDED
eukprot:2421589-Pyramimonas_sp.AAC.1